MRNRVSALVLLWLLIAHRCVFADEMTIDASTVDKILMEKGPFESDEVESACQKLVEQLTDEEQEAAARTSYSYWLSTVHDDIGSSFDKAELRNRFAMREVRRHYIGEDQNFDKALQVLKEAIALRQEYKIDLLRRIHDNPDDAKDLSDEEKETVKRYRDVIQSELAKQVTVVCGVDRDDRAVLVRFSRTNPETDDESYMLMQIYNAERACAATEYLTQGKGEKVLFLSEYGNYVAADAPPTSILRESMSKLQRMYPERLRKTIILDPPFWMRALITILKPFLAQKTKEKILAISGDKDKQEILTQYVDVGTSLTIMNQDDWSMSPDSVDVEKYMNQQMFEIYSSAKE